MRRGSVARRSGRRLFVACRRVARCTDEVPTVAEMRDVSISFSNINSFDRMTDDGGRNEKRGISLCVSVRPNSVVHHYSFQQQNEKVVIKTKKRKAKKRANSDRYTGVREAFRFQARQTIFFGTCSIDFLLLLLIKTNERIVDSRNEMIVE